MSTAIEIYNVSKSYGSIKAVKNLSLSIPQGSVYGLLGPNGAGKTTMFRILQAALKHYSGKVNIFGYPPGHPLVLGGKMTALPQDAILPSHFSIKGFLKYMATLQHVPSSKIDQEIERVSQLVELTDRLSSPCKTLSHGQARRVSLAQCFLGNPELILLDEPTSGLDPRQSHSLRELIASYRTNATVIIASHNLAEVQQLCDHVAIIDSGSLIAAGTVDDICQTTQRIHISLQQKSFDTDTFKQKTSYQPHWDMEKQSLEIEVEQQDQIETVTKTTLQYLLDNNYAIMSLKRGESLEKRYLELT